MRAVTDLVLWPAIREVPVGDDAISEVWMAVGSGVDDPHAYPFAIYARLPDGRHVERRDALVQKCVDRLGRTRDKPRRLEIALQSDLSIFRDVQHDDPRAPMRLADDRIVLAENALGDAGFERHLLGPRQIFRRQHRDADLPRGLDYETGAGLSRNASLGGA